jgi:hypothetical protein
MDFTHKQAPQPDERRSRRAEAVFKPVALPALAAAVCAVRQQPSPTPPRELPPFLRKDAVID